MRFSLAAATLIAATSLFSTEPSLEDIQDTANLPWLNPDLAERTSAKIRLPNGLEAYLISDPNADESGAAMAVHTGSWSDPIEYAGMAHFCEHMLFLGTEKFPDENEFFTLVTNYSGKANAFTAPDRTVYMFSSNSEGFSEILERFAHFFIDPLFKPSGIAREMHAVDQEFSKNIEHDGWRQYMIFKATGNPSHPNAMFSTGNSETLSNIPQSALKKWHEAHYTAPNMRLVLYSSLPLETLKASVANFFASVPKRPASQPILSQDLASPKQKGRMTYIKPIRQRRGLDLSWELPQSIALSNAKSAQIVAYALQRQQPNSLNELLKKEGLIEYSKVGIDRLGGNAHRMFNIFLELTEKGLEQIDTVILRVFQAIASVREAKIPSFLSEELTSLSKLHYQFQARSDAFSLTSSIAGHILDEPLASYPRNELIAAPLNSKEIDAVFRLLSPEQCIYFLQTDPSTLNISLDAKERWMGAEYSVQPISSQKLKAWRSAKPHPEIAIGQPNPFIPKNFAIASAEDTAPIPQLISKDEAGIAYYARAGEFASPSVCFHLHLLTPSLSPSAANYCLASLYLNYLTDRLGPTICAAADAGLHAHLGIERQRLNISVEGFNEQAPRLLQEIVKELRLSPPTLEQFETYRETDLKSYRNAQKDLAAAQAKELAFSIFLEDKPTCKELACALESISYDQFCQFLKSLYQAVYTEALFCGNLTQNEAQTLWQNLRPSLGSSPFAKTNHPKTQILSLPSSGPFAIREQTDALGNAALLVIDEGIFSFETRAAQEIIGAAFKEAFFNTLRTKQKTGYIAQSGALEAEQHLFQYFLVQSNSHQPDDLLHRFELFLEETLQDLPDLISDSRFTTLKQTLSESLRTRFRNLYEKSRLWDLLAFQHDADFAWIEKRLEGFQALSYEKCLSEAARFLSRANRKRLAILFEGRLQMPFSYETVAASDIRQKGSFISHDLQQAH